MDEQFSVPKKCNIQMLVTNLINGTVAAAVKVLKGVYKNDEVTANTVYHMASHPVFLIFGIQNDEDRKAASL